MTKILMFAGQIGSGKSYIVSKKAQELKEVGNSVLMLSFADPIKKFIKDVIGVDKHSINAHVENMNLSLPFEKFVSAFLDKFNRHPMKYVSMIQFKEQYEKCIEDLNSQYENDVFSRGVRGLYQLVGTDMAQSLNKEMWPICLMNTLQPILDDVHIDYVLIDDWRFIFEYFSNLRNFSDCEVIPYFVTASDDTRALRRGISFEELKIQSQHVSERESNEVIFNWMKIYFPDNMIINEG